MRVIERSRNAGPWTTGEIRLLSHGARIAPAPDWLAEASPNPDDASLTLDGMEWTRWISREELRPGMYVGVRLPRAVEIDGIEALSGNGPWESKVDFLALDESGRWVSAQATELHIDPPQDFRRAVARTLKEQGIRYVLIANDGYHGPSFRASAAAWGMQELGATADAGIYRIN